MLTEISRALMSRAAETAISSSSAAPLGVRLSWPPMPLAIRPGVPGDTSRPIGPESSSPTTPKPAEVRAITVVASSLPTTTSGRRTGDTSSTSSVPRSFSPAVLSIAVAMLPAMMNCNRNIGMMKASCPLAVSWGLLASRRWTTMGVSTLSGRPRARSSVATREAL